MSFEMLGGDNYSPYGRRIERPPTPRRQLEPLRSSVPDASSRWGAVEEVNYADRLLDRSRVAVSALTDRIGQVVEVIS